MSESLELKYSIVNEFIDLCIDNYNNGGHSSTKEQEHRYYDLKQQILTQQKIVDKAIHLHISDTKGLALEYLNQLFWYYVGDTRKSESDQNWLIEYKNNIEEFRKTLFKIVQAKHSMDEVKH